VYLPAHFAQDDAAELRRLIEDHPLGTLVTLGSQGLNANHLPFLLVPGQEAHGSLVGHVARNNAVWQDFSDVHDALVIFEGPSAYISPNWYPTKAETHQHVPTYNYVVVHAYGRLVIHDDQKWVRGLVGRLTKRMEASQPRPWNMGQAPSDYMQAMIESIVGIEIEVSRLSGKWKVSQNRLPVDREGAAAALRESGEPEAVAVADLILTTGAPDYP
jgi:transcriptional regulator